MEWNKNRMFKVEPNEVQLFFHIKNNITWPHTANNPIRGTTAIPQKILFISRTDTVLPRRNSMNNAKSIISGTTLTGYENMANISQAANAAFNVLSSEKTNGVIGVPLSFISYGGTSMLITLASIGLVLSVYRDECKREKLERLSPDTRRTQMRVVSPAEGRWQR